MPLWEYKCNECDATWSPDVPRRKPFNNLQCHMCADGKMTVKPSIHSVPYDRTVGKRS